jgi:hypothetical protein
LPFYVKNQQSHLAASLFPKYFQTVFGVAGKQTKLFTDHFEAFGFMALLGLRLDAYAIVVDSVLN